MSPKHTVCFCNNRGGVGKTFMAFQTACEAARSRPDKRVLVIDFSLYSDQTALLLGGSARESFGAPMKGLQVTVDVTTCDTRAEGLIRDLEHAPDAMDCDEDRPASSSIFGTFFSRKRKTTSPGTKTQPRGGGPVDLTRYALRPHDHNPAIPPNLYLIPSAGATSWADTQSDHAGQHGYTDPPEETQIPLWARRGDGWLFAARKLRVALDALPDDFGAVFVDTDHLAACVLTKLALASCEKVIVPLSFDDGDFNRLFQDVTGQRAVHGRDGPHARRKRSRRACKRVGVHEGGVHEERGVYHGRGHSLAVQAQCNGDGADGRHGAAGAERVPGGRAVREAVLPRRRRRKFGERLGSENARGWAVQTVPREVLLRDEARAGPRGEHQ
jgi:cellulose biosynthesis protein BcsQ